MTSERKWLYICGSGDQVKVNEFFQKNQKSAMGTHTISNASTFHGWLESVGLDDFLENPCSCIFGEEEEVPIPGQRRNTTNRGRNQSQRGQAGGQGARPRSRREQVSRQATVDSDEPNSPFKTFSFFGGGSR